MEKNDTLNNCPQIEDFVCDRLLAAEAEIDFLHAELARAEKQMNKQTSYTRKLIERNWWQRLLNITNVWKQRQTI